MRPIYGCPEKFRDSLTTPTLIISKILRDFVPMAQFLYIGPHTYYSSISTRLPEILDCSFGWGGCEPPILGKGRPYGVKDSTVRKSVDSIVTFPLSLRVSEILPLLFSSMLPFPYSTSSLPKIFHVPLGVGGSPFGYKERSVGLIVRAISFPDFQHM